MRPFLQATFAFDRAAAEACGWSRRSRDGAPGTAASTPGALVASAFEPLAGFAGSRHRWPFSAAAKAAFAPVGTRGLRRSADL